MIRGSSILDRRHQAHLLSTHQCGRSQSRKDAIDDGDGGAQLIQGEMAVSHRHGDRLVAERLLHLLQHPAALDEPGRERVPEVMEPEAVDAGGR